VAGQSNLNALPDWFQKVEGLRSALHQPFILSVKLYQQALALIEDSPDIAYLNLVSAIEVLSGEFDVGPVTLADRDSKLALLVARIPDEDLRRDIERRSLELERFIGRRFVRFILDHVEEDFWDHADRPEMGRVESDNLPKLLKRVYAFRSKALHSGEPFPAFVLRPPLMGAEIPFGFSFAQGERQWDEKDYIPYAHFFERLIQHVLLNFLKRNQTN